MLCSGLKPERVNPPWRVSSSCRHRGLIEKWARQYRTEGEDGLRQKPKGRPRTNPGTTGMPESELERLRRENERLRAEVAFLGKVQALRNEQRR